MAAGTELEDAILARYVAMEGCEVIERAPATIRHPEYQFLIAHPDLIVRNAEDDRWNVDAKRVAWSDQDSATWGDPDCYDEIEIPQDEYWQGIHYNFVTEVGRTDFAVCVAGAWPPAIYKVPRDDDRYARALPTLVEFWRCVERETPPEPDFAHKTTLELLRRMHSTINRRQVVKLAPADGSLVDALGALREFRVDVDRAIRAVQARLLFALGDARKGVDPNTGAQAFRRSIRGGFVTYERQPYVRMTTLSGAKRSVTRPELLQLIDGVSRRRSA